MKIFHTALTVRGSICNEKNLRSYNGYYHKLSSHKTISVAANTNYLG